METSAEEAQPQPGEVIHEDELEVIDTVARPLGLDVIPAGYQYLPTLKC